MGNITAEDLATMSDAEIIKLSKQHDAEISKAIKKLFDFEIPFLDSPQDHRPGK